jgi:hypothetical protein
MTTFNLGHPVFDGGTRLCIFPLMCLSEWREFPTTISIPSYDNREVGRANDLSAPPVVMHGHVNIKLSERHVQVSIDPEAAELSANYCVSVTWLGVLPHTAHCHWQIALQYLSSN